MAKEKYISKLDGSVLGIRDEELIIRDPNAEKAKEIDWEAFQNLSEEEKNNGTTYYIKDYPGLVFNAEMIKYGNGNVKEALDKNASDISTLSNDAVIDVTNEFTVNQPSWFSATYNPKSRTVTITLSANFSGIGGVANGHTKITPPSKYAPLAPNLGWLGCAGMVRSSDNTFYYPLINVSSGIFAVYYSANIIAETLGVSFTYQIA